MTYYELRKWLDTLPHEEPGYYDGDLYCPKCGEPWDSKGLRMGDMTKNEAKRFLEGKGCPCCWKKL